MLTGEELEQNRLMSLKVCEQSYLMYENTKKELVEEAPKKKNKDGTPLYNEQAIKKNLRLIETAQQDVIDQYIQMGGKKEDLEKLKTSKKKVVNRKALEELMKKETAKDEFAAYISEMREKDVIQSDVEQKVDVMNPPYKDTEPIFEVVPKEELTSAPKFNQIPAKEEVEHLNTQTAKTPDMPIPQQENKMYDMVSLPSKGQCYRNKKDKIKVAYLTAFDENMILSPNMYKDGKFIDYLLQAKIFEEGIKPEDLTRGDRDAIILWLRATGYGNEYPIVVTDEETGKEFETTVDLSSLKYKPFKLKGDINGYFDYKLPSTGDIIKFRFLTVQDLDVLEKQKVKENKKINVFNIREICSNLVDAIRDNELVSAVAQQKVKNVVELVRDELNKNYDEENDLTFSHELTDRLLLQTVSINGIFDRKYIENYIFSMNVKDAASYRKYIIDNEPGVDFNIEVERPESLGGGSIKSFLRLDQFIFINF